MAANRRRQFFILTGIGLLAVAVIVLLISPAFILSPTVTVIGSDLNKSSENQVKVTTKTDFNDTAQMAAFPRDLGNWHGKDFDSTDVAKQLNAPVVLFVQYQPDTFAQPLFLTIVQSKTNSSFHDPDYCFKFQGYEIQENVQDFLTISDQSWTAPQPGLTIPLNKLIVTKSNNVGQIYLRSAVLFFYVKGNPYYTDKITMVEVQTLIPVSGSYEETLYEEKVFISRIFPLLFQAGSNIESTPVMQTLAEKGVPGYLGIGFILLVPMAVMAYPFLRRRDNNQ